MKTTIMIHQHIPPVLDEETNQESTSPRNRMKVKETNWNAPPVRILTGAKGIILFLQAIQ